MSTIVREWSVYFVLLCIASVPPVWTAVAAAEESPAPDPVVQAEEVVVSATKTPLPVTQVTSAVEVITAQDMKRQNIRSVVDALRLAQGVAVFSNGGPGTEVTAKIRGGGANQTLVLIDGAIVNSGTVGSYNFANLTTDNIERVEILRGSQSMLWGSDAMGGVINIVTKKRPGSALRHRIHGIRILRLPA
jgi:vitamin B12 transporter